MMEVGIRIGDRKYMNEYIPFGSVSLCDSVCSVCSVYFVEKCSVLHVPGSLMDISCICNVNVLLPVFMFLSRGKLQK